MPDPIHTSDGGTLWVHHEKRGRPSATNRLATQADVRGACGCTVELAEAHESAAEAWHKAGDHRLLVSLLKHRDAEHLDTIAELSEMVERMAAEYRQDLRDTVDGIGTDNTRLRTALAEAKAEVERLQQLLNMANGTYKERAEQQKRIVDLETEVERLRRELETDRKNGQDQWLWANDADGPTYNHRRDDSPETPCELCKARAEVERLRRERDAMARVVDAARDHVAVEAGHYTGASPAASLVRLSSALDALDSPQPDAPPCLGGGDPEHCASCDDYESSKCDAHGGRPRSCPACFSMSPTYRGLVAGVACAHAWHDSPQPDQPATPKPTLDELEDIIAGNKRVPVEILPSGEIRVKPDQPTPPEPAAEPDRAMGWPVPDDHAKPCPHASTTEYRDGVEDCDDCGEQLRGADGAVGSEGGERRCPSCEMYTSQDGRPECYERSAAGRKDACEHWTPRTKGGG